MKQFILAATLLFSLSAFASPNYSADITAAAKKSLINKYGNNANIEWKENAGFNKASVLVEKQKVEVFYDHQGDLIATTKTIDFDKLPKSAIQSITTRYTFPEYNLKECIELVDNYNNKKYFVSMKTGKERVILEISKNGAVSTYTGEQ